MKTPKIDRIPNYVQHIILAISQIEEYARGLDKESFIANNMAHDAIIRQFEIIGEASNKIKTADPDFAKKYGATEFDGAYKMRNFLAHEYDKVNLPTVWNAIEENLPVLKKQMIVTRDKLFADLKSTLSVQQKPTNGGLKP